MENKRLTEKVENTGDYIKLPTKDKQEFINKLGRLEDILQSYNVKDLEELDKLLGRATNYKKMEELLVKIGCPLDVILRALTNGIYVKDFSDVVEVNLANVENELYLINKYYAVYVKVKDHKITWFLKEDKE